MTQASLFDSPDTLAALKAAGPVTVALRPYQEEACARIDQSLETVRSTLLVMATGCHVAGQKLLMYDGSLRLVEDVAVGDRLMGPDSEPRTVLSLARGEDEIVEVNPVKGSPWRVNRDHILTLVSTNQGRGRAGGRVVDVAIPDWQRWGSTAKHIHKLFRVGVTFPDRSPPPLDPYVIGLWIGDGQKDLPTFAVTKPDSEVGVALGAFAASIGAKLRRSDADPGCTRWAVVTGGGRGRSWLLHTMRSMFQPGDDLRIPDDYRLGSLAVRLQVLAGILDADGCVSSGGFDFISKSRALSDDVAFVARSVGLAAYVSEAEKGCQTGAVGTYWRVSISGDCSMLPTRIARRKAKPRKQKKDVLRTGFSIASTGRREPYFGFTLSGDGRYLLDDFTVTHNTGKTTVFAETIRRRAGKVLVLAHRDELIRQASTRIAMQTGRQVSIEKAAEYGSRSSDVVVASVQTLLQEERLKRFAADHFELVVVDECFPAGTLVDGCPIETVKVGDLVTAVDHRTGEPCLRRVVRVFRKEARSLVRVRVAGRQVDCTGNHPFFVKGRGYVEAEGLKVGDLLCLRDGVHADGVHVPAAAAGVFERVSTGDLVGDYGAHEPKGRVGANDEEQPDAAPRLAGKDEGDAAGDRARAEGARRGRPRAYGGRDGTGGGAGMGDRRGGADQGEAGTGVSDLLQAGRREPADQGLHRGGRRQPRGAGTSGAGPEEGGVLVWARVDGVARLEPGSPGGAAVYNLEVDGAHTYFANGVLVHNCHHAVADSYRRVIDWFAPAKVLGVTATPDRADEQAMGQVFDDVAFIYEINDAIADGFLCPIKAVQVQCDAIDLREVKTVAGDLDAGQLDDVMATETALHQVAKPTMELAGGRRTLVFTTSVANAHRLAEVFCRYKPDCARAVDGAMDQVARRRVLADHQAGRFQYLINVGVLTEGYDDPAVACVAMGRPTKSRALYAQMAGRGTRIAPGKADLLLLDFVGNSGRHALISAVDILAGKHSDDVVERAKEKVAKEPGTDPRAALEAAAAELAAEKERQRVEAERRRGVKVQKVGFTTNQVDPFAVLGVRDPAEYGSRFGDAVASDAQVQLLQRMKLPVTEGMTKRQASKLIGEVFRRRKADLCTFGQARALGRYGYDTSKMTFHEARNLMDQLAANGWKRLPSNAEPGTWG